MDQIPLAMRREIENLRRAEVTGIDLENVARRFVGIFPVSEREIFNLMRTFPAADGAEQMPAAVVVNNRRVFDGETGIFRTTGRSDQRCADSPVEPSNPQILNGALTISIGESLAVGSKHWRTWQA